MPKVDYSLDKSILEFFASLGTSMTRAQCDDFARGRYGGPVEPVPIQGMTSYTITAGPNGDKIIQFREEAAMLDMKILALAQQIHESFVPECNFLQWIGSKAGQRLAIYEMDKLRGDNYIMVRALLADQYERRLATIHSLARLVRTLPTLVPRLKLNNLKNEDSSHRPGRIQYNTSMLIRLP